MECSYWSKLLLLSLFSFLIGSVFSQDIGDILLTDSIACDTFPPPRNLDGMTQDDAVYLFWHAPFPANLIGYNVYRNNEHLDYVEYEGDSLSFYWDHNVPWFSFNEYYVTALYDLSPCGFTGDTAESEPSDTVGFWVGIDFILPFVENWATGSFDPNLWNADIYWSVDGDYGYPPPCAIFNNLSDTSYYQKLESYSINCRDHPNTQDPYIDGDFFLDFELNFGNLCMPGTSHHLNVEMMTDSTEWQVIKSFDNSGGSFHDLFKLNITDIAKGHHIKFRFVAYGDSGAFNFHTWIIDNIMVYRKCNPPRDLHWIEAGEVMSWSPPLPHTSKGFTGYNIFSEYNLIEFTTDTFYIFDPTVMSGPIYVEAVYEDCRPVSNSIWGNVGIEDQAPAEINLFPNPANNQITIQADEEIDQISIIDPNGKSLYQQLSSNTKELINVSGFANGFYIAEIMIDGNNIRKKFIIHNP